MATEKNQDPYTPQNPNPGNQLDENGIPSQKEGTLETQGDGKNKEGQSRRNNTLVETGSHKKHSPKRGEKNPRTLLKVVGTARAKGKILWVRTKLVSLTRARICWKGRRDLGGRKERCIKGVA